MGGAVLSVRQELWPAGGEGRAQVREEDEDGRGQAASTVLGVSCSPLRDVMGRGRHGRVRHGLCAITS